MPVLHLPAELRENVRDRIGTVSEPIAWSLVATRRPDGAYGLFALIIRSAVDIEPLSLESPHGVLIAREQLSGPDAARRFDDSVAWPARDRIPQLQFSGPPQGLRPLWITSNETYGYIGRAEWPSYYFGWTPVEIGSAGSSFLEPFTAPGYFYSYTYEAIAEIVYGIAPEPGMTNLPAQVLVLLPDRRARLGHVTLEDDRMVVAVEEGVAHGAKGYALQATWRLLRTDVKRGRKLVDLREAGPMSFDLGAQPVEFVVFLTAPDGSLVDKKEWYPEPDSELPPASPLALMEQLDFLEAVWRLAFHKPLLRLKGSTKISRLAFECTTRADFEVRLSDLADILKSIEIPDDLLPADKRGLPQDSSLARMEATVGSQLDTAERARIADAVATLRSVNKVRWALQHAGAGHDLATAFAKLKIAYPPKWADAWVFVRSYTVQALSVIREVVQELAFRSS